MMTTEELIEHVARLGFESQFEELWVELPRHSIEREMWLKTARLLVRYIVAQTGEDV